MEYEISGGGLEEAIADGALEAVADAILLGVYAGGRLGEAATRMDARLGGRLAAACGSGSRAFGRQPGDTDEVNAGVADRPVRVVLVALGDPERVGAETVRRAAASAMRRAAGSGARRVRSEALGAGPSLPPIQAAQATVEGAGLALDAMARERGGPGPGALPRLFALHGPIAGLPAGLRRGRILTQCVVLARELANLASGGAAGRFLERVRDAFARSSVQAGPLDGAASPESGFVALRFRGAHPSPGPEGAEAVSALTLVGVGRRGAGGAGLAGPAAVAGAFAAIADLRPSVDVDGVIAIADEQAVPPGVLSQAMMAARRRGTRRIVEVASFADGALAALGREMAVLMSNDQELGDAVQGAGAAAGERLWPLPVDPAYREPLAPGEAEAIAAGMAVGEFADNMPWCHVDLWAAAAGQRRPYHPLDSDVANGFGARTLAILAERLRPD